MPYKEGKRWRGVVRFTPTHGPIIRRTKFFETKKQAGDWEGETVKALKVADQRNPAKADVIGRALTVMEWANRYLDHLEATMCRKTYNEKRSAFQRMGGASGTTGRWSGESAFTWLLSIWSGLQSGIRHLAARVAIENGATIMEVACLLRVHRATVSRLIGAGALPHLAMGLRKLVPETGLPSFLENRRSLAANSPKGE